MDRLDCDILVVGAGPAGSAAARAAAKRGANVLLVERRATVGMPVQCAEYIPAMLMGKIGLGRKFVAQSVQGMKTFRTDGPETITKAPGFVIHRDRFDQTLAGAAEAEGATLMTATRAIARQESGTVTLRTSQGREIKVQPRILIGADGPHSTVGRWVGAVNQHLLPGVQMTLALTRPLDHTEVYFTPDIYAGYGWLFPKGTVANVGLGLKPCDRCPDRIRRILEKFVDDLKSRGKVKGNPLGYAAGWIPAEPVRNAVYGNVALVGDAAGHTHPITGAGIFAAVAAGEMAGKWAGRAIAENNDALLESYDEDWQDLLGDTLTRARQRRVHMEEHWNNFTATVQKCWVAYREYYAAS